ncbi:MAG: class IV adenylate cyclase [Candidatus Paceibacterota bacterium]|jgi:adenylate cyclase class 2
MNEIEVKAKLKDKEKVIEHLKKIGAKFLGAKSQKDLIFWPNDIKNLSSNLLGRNFLRIREQESNGIKKVIFTLKQPQTNKTDCIEHEIEINEKDIPELKSLISTLGYYEFVTLEKIRTIAKIEDIEICMDEVSNLGSYIELEKFAPANEAKKIQNELYSILKSFGVKKEDFVYDGYDILVLNAQKK